ncbi:flagellar biosynthetic protein FliQ [Aestuariivirga sp.]|uniref:flagellar biosynthetic protein FliQ n=1 Tax=Aestuariivirga sp. TaxID=2650926 RepID=UPI0025B7D809|nr:flagellar biosynthetic protein FliQ [Aestuariivirga sp.]MCA3554258.1 flagellar biosynthetic protein FliQ [Aestuariivirga sp.]
MNEADALKLVQDAIWAVIVGAGPAVGAATLIGIVIALIQALTQVQEATLTFVPKILAVFAALLLLAPVAAGQLMSFTEQVYAHIETGF